MIFFRHGDVFVNRCLQSSAVDQKSKFLEQRLFYHFSNFSQGQTKQKIKKIAFQTFSENWSKQKILSFGIENGTDTFLPGMNVSQPNANSHCFGKH
jgi:hypothetical protein